jgi:hypothetical protein
VPFRCPIFVREDVVSRPIIDGIGPVMLYANAPADSESCGQHNNGNDAEDSTLFILTHTFSKKEK